MKVIMTDEARDMFVPLLMENKAGIMERRDIPIWGLLKCIEDLSKAPSKKVKLWKFVAFGSAIAGGYLYLKNRKLQLRVEELIDQVDDLELEKALNADEEDIIWEDKEMSHTDI